VTSDEAEGNAREAAWSVLGITKTHTPGALVNGFREVFDAGWDSRGRYDGGRIAALVPTDASCFCDEAYTNRGLQDHACHYHHYDWLWEELVTGASPNDD
jgi:hypothetical protein